MKCVSIIVGALAAFTVAAPTKETRSQFDASQLNNFQFSNLNLNYLNVVNSLNLQLLEQLGSVNNLNVVEFQSLFQSQNFQLQEVLQFQQLQMVLQLAQLGLFNGFDLSSLNFNQINLGLINNLNGFDLNSVVDQSLVPQITQVVQTAVVAKE
jgi:hypothetical protein